MKLSLRNTLVGRAAEQLQRPFWVRRSLIVFHQANRQGSLRLRDATIVDLVMGRRAFEEVHRFATIFGETSATFRVHDAEVGERWSKNSSRIRFAVARRLAEPFHGLTVILTGASTSGITIANAILGIRTEIL